MGLKRVDLVEILDLAMLLESCSESYYRIASQRLAQGPLRKMMESLAEQEASHSDRFQELLGEAVVQEMFRDAESEVVTKLLVRVPLTQLLKEDLEAIGARVNCLLEEKDHVLESLEKLESPAELVNFSIYLEETAVQVYEALLKYVSGPVARGWLRAVLYEEKSHLNGFLRLRSQLAAKEQVA